MKKIFFLPLFVLAITVQSQKKDSARKNGRPRISINADSVAVKLQQMKDSVDRTPQAVDGQDMERNISSLLRLQKDINDREAKQKRNAILRIAIGLVLLIVLIIGIRRRRVKRP